MSPPDNPLTHDGVNFSFTSTSPFQLGWICPLCGRGNAPWNPYCSCMTPPITLRWVNR